ncbi:flagellar biosynthesis protein FlhF [Caldisalinibacter kiritimatiensis]|uniref:Flagellar biosynthesis protein FlhF n=1 Tax=Caldisalinibacter kiritimatiensis TaxID=1304284 RepID=R1CBM7_9FIRM|nr:flagellar biosynthesis protein FlhF [Caldisalinibacter kiritimatiensis]EOC99724.1 Flagellar biosynthesis protein FlhF [Caldisalinibacter kiritimatiensis]
MKIRRYIGNSNKEVMDKLRKELGSDAVILHTRKIKKPGILGLFKRQLIEVVAALDDSENGLKKQAYKKEYNNNLGFSEINQNSLFKTRSNMKNENTEDKNNEVNEEIKKLRVLMEDFIKNTDDKNSEERLSPELKRYLDNLINNGVEEKVAFNILNKIDKHMNIKALDQEKTKNVVKKSIINYIGEPKQIELDGSQKVVFFVGPTGVGKTTTLAKIAANFTIQNKDKVGLITADTYRIAAVEQLKTYSEILDIPLKIIYETEEIYEALSNLSDKELILVDTAGRSHKNQHQINELTELINSVNNKEIFLVLSASTDWKTVKSIIENYNFLEDYKIIFTKLDETEDLGIILNSQYYYKKSLSYFTVGQNVPEDIRVADVKLLTKQLIGE